MSEDNPNDDEILDVTPVQTTTRALAPVARPMPPSGPVVSADAISPTAVKERFESIRSLIHETMQESRDFGLVPGCGNKPALFKSGAEKMQAMFQLVPEYIVDERLVDGDSEYTIHCRLSSVGGVFLGEGLGASSTLEDKYAWRAAVCPQEYDATPANLRREKWGRGYGGNPPSCTKQVRQTPSAIRNTVLKMGKKRALVDAVLGVTGTSDLFTQDLEDLREIIAEQNATQGTPQAQRPAPATNPAERTRQAVNAQADAYGAQRAAQQAHTTQDGGYTPTEPGGSADDLPFDSAPPARPAAPSGNLEAAMARGVTVSRAAGRVPLGSLDEKTLRFVRERATKSLADPSKAQWHANTRLDLAAVELILNSNPQ